MSHLMGKIIGGGLHVGQALSAWSGGITQKVPGCVKVWTNGRVFIPQGQETQGTKFGAKSREIVEDHKSARVYDT